ncbi:MAG: hypothetical protein EOO89_00300 [Pedobacter sp.]|nr:MAG: hypothetical protein EOO89_00300 [Pedobacter sp.]
MSYPKIFSLSTVGILKHYVHDYLFHPLRTDFIGPNGVGKSIIADLLQLMFVYDSSLIKFGTDGVKKDERSIYKLPYNLTNAYCFLNIEVSNGRYIIIGISISSQTSSRITPFVITRSAELERDIEDLTLSPTQRLFAKDILSDGKVQDLKPLANTLLADRELYLTFFKTKEDTKKYYQFLFDKQILSINLSIDDHLSAFAKVIQSFSKAKSLDLSPSKASRSLKQFLFEDVDAGLENEFRRQQGQLEKLLRDFASLEKYVGELRSKQLSLSDLKKKDSFQQQSFKDFKIGEFSNLLNILQEAKDKETLLQNEIIEQKEKKQITEQRSHDIPAIKLQLKIKLDDSNNYTQLYNAYILALENQERLNNDIISLKLINPPNLSSEWLAIDNASTIEELSAVEITTLISDVRPYLKKFVSPKELETAFDQQKDKVAKLHQSIKDKLNNIDQLVSILNSNTQDSILGWGMKHASNLTATQHIVFLRYAVKAIQAPLQPKDGDTYMDPESLLQAVEDDSAPHGIWIRLGALHEYVSKQPNEINPLSSNANNQTIAEIITRLEGDKTQLNSQLQALDSFYRGLPYKTDLLNDSLDPFLINYENIKLVNTAAFCIKNLDNQIKKQETEHINCINKSRQIRSQLPSEITYDEPEVIQRELKRIATQALDNYTACCQEETIIENSLHQVEVAIQKSTQHIAEVTSTILKHQLDLATMRSLFYNIFHETLEIIPLAEQYADTEKLKNIYNEAQQDYRVKYLDIVNQFPETSSNKHASVNIEISEKSFDFTTLESALLGSKIKHSDEISKELEDANRNRMNMADDIKNTMVLIFNRTVEAYKHYKDTVYTLNQFFQGVKISNRFFFSINFAKNDNIRIEILEDIGTQVRNAAKRGELPFDKPVDTFIEDFFKRTAQIKDVVTIDRLLNAKTFFELSVSLTDEYGQEIPGSTGETYSAIALLGIARLSLVQKEKRKGLRFIILEELGSLDTVNFNTFPAIAKEFAYQIITMAPSPFRSNLDDEWYAHHLIKGISDQNINYHPSASYFKTKNGSKYLEEYLKLNESELD